MAEAEQLSNQTLAADPNHAGAKLMLVRLAAAQSSPALAEQKLRQVVAAHPDSFEGLMTLAWRLCWEGDVDEAISFCKRALQLRPNSSPPHYQLGCCYNRKGRHAEALLCFEKSLAINPSAAIAHHQRGVALRALNRVPEAAEAFEKALSLDPKLAAAYEDMGEIYLEHGNVGGAISCFKKFYQLEPRSAKGSYLLGRALVEERRYEEADRALRQAFAIDPKMVAARILLARSLQNRGQAALAETELKKAMAIDPYRPDLYCTVVMGTKITPQDGEMIASMVRLSKEPWLSPAATSTLHFALGKAYDDLGEYQKAIKSFDSANELQERLKPGKFDSVKLKSTVDEAIAWFTNERMQSYTKFGSDSEKPVFIVGMPRSGTTLLEQIVSSHTDVSAAGELGVMNAMLEGPFNQESPKESEVQAIVQKYLTSLEKSANPDSSRITEKTPGNYEVLGPILATFPRAKVLHCRRHPVDNCISLYTTPFMAPTFAHNKKSLVFAYKQYLRIMEHWKSVLPPGTILDVNYEDVVRDREPIVRQVLEHLGLEWDEACMHHDKNENAISTPSLWQARQPIFTSSVARWKNYEPWLGPLAELLELDY
jgi:tetratricopeptide (TPR) repeat protein